MYLFYLLLSHIYVHIYTMMYKIEGYDVYVYAVSIRVSLISYKFFT